MATFNNPRHTAATVTASATLVRGYHTPVDATAGPLTMTLPGNAPVGVEISVEKVDSSANTVTVSGTLRGAVSSTPLTSQYEARTFLSEGNGSWRPTSDHRTATSLTTVVTSALAADPTPKNAAAAAVAAQLSQAGTLTGTTTGGTLDDEVFGITDASNRKSWLAIGADGGPPDRVKAILQTITQAGSGFTVVKSDALGRSYNIVDASGREAFWIDETGALGWRKLAPDTISRLVDAFTTSGYSSVPTFYKGPLGVQHRMASGPNIICPGDSLTAGAGSSTIPPGSTVTTATTYPQRLQALLDARLGSGAASVTNAGVGGETSVTIAARMNATPLLATVAGGTIPASGPVTITLLPINGSTPRPLLQGDGGGTTGILWVKGVPVAGTLGIVQPGGASSTYNAGTDSYKFTRATSGTAITADRTHSFTYDFADAHRDDIHIIWVGQNGPSDTRARTDTDAIIQRMTALDKRFLVMARPSNNDADDSAWHDLYARRYVAVRAHLVQYGLAEAGLTATTQDNSDIAAGTVPTSLRSDGIHGNAAYYYILGTLVYHRLVELGWV